MDAFSVQVVASWPLEDGPVPVFFRLRRESCRVRGRPVAELNKNVSIQVGSRGLVRLGDDVSNLAVSDGDVSQNILHTLLNLGVAVDEDQPQASLLTLLLVEPLAKLVFSKSLTELLILARWHGAASLFPEWPPARWVSLRSHRMYAPRPSSISVDSVRALASDLRRWHEMLSPPNDEGPGDEQQVMERWDDSEPGNSALAANQRVSGAHGTKSRPGP